jgi:hypothetical protein
LGLIEEIRQVAGNRAMSLPCVLIVSNDSRLSHHFEDLLGPEVNIEVITEGLNLNHILGSD